MKSQMKSSMYRVILAAAPLLLAGCAVNSASNEPQTVPLQEIHGKVMGGEQPIQGANIYYYAAGTTGYASTNTAINTSSVTTGSDGSFTLTGHYTACTAGQQMYIVSQGGNTGAGTNANQSTMAALGDCANINSSTYILINEVTTVAAAYALSPFATSYTNIGTDAGNTAGLVRAFANAAKLANTANGTAVTTLANGGTVPAQEIYALADILTSCVNSNGGVATNTSTNCGALFNYATPPSGTAPTDTFGAALNFAKYPTNNAAQIFGRIPSPAPFATTFSSANDLTLSIVYTGFNTPKSTSVDANGQVWVANSGNNTVTVLAQNGAAVSGSPFSLNGLNAPSAIAIDSTGNAWAANTGGTTVSAFTNSGVPFGSSPFTVGTAPNSLAFDATGNVWVGNSTGNSVTELNSAGTLVQTISSGVTAPGAIVIDPK